MRELSVPVNAVKQRVRARAKFFFEGDYKFFLKGVTYGTFAPDSDGYYVGPPEKARIDLSLMREIGVNGVRVYHAPPKWFLDLCYEFGIRVMVTLWWGQNVDFLSSGRRRREIFAKVHSDVNSNAGHPALLGYLVANEISSTMVRWYGVRRVTEFVENMINIGRDADDDVLFSYASYPPTEYLLPTNMDFYTFNVYLHRRSDFDRYLARLQNLAEDRPLIMGEFGMDTLRHSEKEQAEILAWHIESVVRGGLAGTFLYTWTDEWWCNGQDITDWAFGLTTRERLPKEALSRVKSLFAGPESVTRKVSLPRYPKVSVIVCSYNGAKTLERCLESLRRIEYPDYEVILVDDGSKDDTEEIASRNRWITYLRQENSGLSMARNVGARAATGEVLAYTDSDCMADPQWLYFMVGTLLSGAYAGVGGPNVSPPAENWIQACVAAAPGGPNHVLLTDQIAEHIPGCNMAFYKWAFERVGGFDPEYRKAGDDVDFCWRLQQDGQIIGFSPSAIVWHYRRFTLAAFRRQQNGYGEAESLLRFKHLVFFGPTGTAKWKGQIYGAPRFTWLINRPIIYHGIFGEGLFQSIYPTPQSDLAGYLSSIEWVVLTFLVFCLSIPLPFLRIVPYLMFGGTFLVALSHMIHAKLEPKHDTILARLLVAFLAL
ncbi:MAG TPA: glycosyltransferase, partial [Terrimicrobiaceae bacterium]|nr:glycosyltransferase [Terrimicrobiaceae bacterium]